MASEVELDADPVLVVPVHMTGIPSQLAAPLCAFEELGT